MIYEDACPACRLENPVSREARLNAALLAKKRFEGRAALEERAKWIGPQGDVALAKLRQKIGFPGADQELHEAREALAAREIRGHLFGRRLRESSFKISNDEADRQASEETSRLLAMSQRERVVWCHRHAAECGEITKYLAPDEMASRTNLRQKRQLEKQSNNDKIAARHSGYALDLQTRKVFLKTLEEAGFREATHSHENKITLSERGHEGVQSRTSSISASDAGLGRAYQKRARSVAASEHVWFVSAEILTPEVKALNASAPKGILYLRADLRAKQGAGTSINIERKTPRGAWK